MIPGPKAPDGAHNVLLVLTKMRGSALQTPSGANQDAELHPRAEDGDDVQQLPMSLPCARSRGRLSTGRNAHRVGFGSTAEAPAPFPGYKAVRPKSCAGLPADPPGQWLCHRRVWEVASDPDNVPYNAGPFDHWPKVWGFDRWWGYLSGRPVSRPPSKGSTSREPCPGNASRFGLPVLANGRDAGRLPLAAGGATTSGPVPSPPGSLVTKTRLVLRRAARRRPIFRNSLGDIARRRPLSFAEPLECVSRRRACVRDHVVAG